MSRYSWVAWNQKNKKNLVKVEFKFQKKNCKQTVFWVRVGVWYAAKRTLPLKSETSQRALWTTRCSCVKSMKKTGFNFFTLWKLYSHLPWVIFRKLPLSLSIRRYKNFTKHTNWHMPNEKQSIPLEVISGSAFMSKLINDIFLTDFSLW